jgi:hypothetical protein
MRSLCFFLPSGMRGLASNLPTLLGSQPLRPNLGSLTTNDREISSYPFRQLGHASSLAHKFRSHGSILATLPASGCGVWGVGA